MIRILFAKFKCQGGTQGFFWRSHSGVAITQRIENRFGTGCNSEWDSPWIATDTHGRLPWNDTLAAILPDSDCFGDNRGRTASCTLCDNLGGHLPWKPKQH